MECSELSRNVHRILVPSRMFRIKAQGFLRIAQRLAGLIHLPWLRLGCSDPTSVEYYPLVNIQKAIENGHL